MSVLIKDMEMPTSCADCRFAVDGWCYACPPESEAERQRITTNYCPLRPVPEHGQLPELRSACQRERLQILRHEIQTEGDEMRVELLEYPTGKDWMEVKRRALVTIGKRPISPPTEEWKREILRARHSPIRYLRFSFLITDLPSWVSVHLCRHVHAQPYVRSQRNDRQSEYDRNKAPQDSPVDMIFDVNGEELMVIANKRLCRMASEGTQMVVAHMVCEVNKVCPEFTPFLVPMCEYTGGCKEMNGGCGRWAR